MLDSNANIPSGLMDHQYTSVGSYKQCLQIRSEHQKRSISGQFCFLTFSISNSTANVTSESETKWIRKTSAAHIRFLYAFGLCIPDSCTSEELENLFQISPKFRQTNLQTVSIKYCQTDKKSSIVETVVVNSNVYSL